MEVTPSDVDCLGEEEVRGGVLDIGRSVGGSLGLLGEGRDSGSLCLGGGFDVDGVSKNQSEDLTFFGIRPLCRKQIFLTLALSTS